MYPPLTKQQYEDLGDRFLYHSPSTEAIADAHSLVSDMTLHLAQKLSEIIPPSRGLSLALTKLEETRMWANQAIATGQKLRGVE